MRHLGDAHGYAKQTAEAESCYIEALSIYRSNGHTQPLDLANAIGHYAGLKDTVGADEEARDLWQEAHEIYALVKVPSGVAGSAAHLALLAQRRGDLELSREWLAKAVSAAALSNDPEIQEYVGEVKAQISRFIMRSTKSANLDRYATEAKELLDNAHAGRSDALDRLRTQPEYKSLAATDRVELDDAQLVVARENGFSDSSQFKESLLFRDAVHALDKGDYSWLEDLLKQHESSLIDLLVAAGEPKVPMEQAFTWACMLGRINDVETLLDKGVDPLAGDNTGLNGFHYAGWHGHLDIVKLLIERKVPLEVRNMYGGTVLGSTLDAVTNRPQADHVAIVEALLEAGAMMDEGEYPTGNARVDELLRSHGAKSRGE